MFSLVLTPKILANRWGVDKKLVFGHHGPGRILRQTKSRGDFPGAPWTSTTRVSNDWRYQARERLRLSALDNSARSDFETGIHFFLTSFRRTVPLRCRFKRNDSRRVHTPFMPHGLDPISHPLCLGQHPGQAPEHVASPNQRLGGKTDDSFFLWSGASSLSAASHAGLGAHERWLAGTSMRAAYRCSVESVLCAPVTLNNKVFL